MTFTKGVTGSYELRQLYLLTPQRPVTKGCSWPGPAFAGRYPKPAVAKSGHIPLSAFGRYAELTQSAMSRPSDIPQSGPLEGSFTRTPAL
jgi:hypothetical protein